MPSIFTFGAATIHGFAPPVLPPPVTLNVAMLLHLDGATGSTTILDETGKSNPVIVGANCTQQPGGKFGNGLSRVAGGGYMKASPEAFGLRDFTIEMWINPSANVTALQYLFDFRTTATSELAPALSRQSDNSVAWQVGTSVRIQAGIISTSAWTALAITRSGGVSRLYVNGVRVGQVADVNNYASTNIAFGLSLVSAGSFLEFSGMTDEVRITLDKALYEGASYVLQTAPFTYP